MLNPMQKDALTEIINVYIGKAASMLSEMVNQRVILSVPEVELIAFTQDGQPQQTAPPPFFLPGISYLLPSGLDKH